MENAGAHHEGLIFGKSCVGLWAGLGEFGRGDFNLKITGSTSKRHRDPKRRRQRMRAELEAGLGAPHPFPPWIRFHENNFTVVLWLLYSDVIQSMKTATSASHGLPLHTNNTPLLYTNYLQNLLVLTQKNYAKRPREIQGN